MPVTPEDVRHVAALARVALSESQLAEFAKQLDDILGHVAVLGSVDTSRGAPAAGNSGGGMPLREDRGECLRLARPIASFAPAMREGYFSVPRLETHGDNPGVLQATAPQVVPEPP